MDAGYYPRRVGGKETLSKQDSRKYKKRRAVRARLGSEAREQSVPDMEALERTISDLQSQLDCATQIIVVKDNDLERFGKEKETQQQAYNRVKQRMRQIRATLRREGV